MLFFGSKMFYVHAQMSEHALYALYSMHMPIGQNGLSMPTEGWSVCMPIVMGE